MAPDISPQLRLGSVPYLNARPLIRYLALGRSLPIRLEVPSRLTRLLADCQIDVALLPSVEYLRAPDYSIPADICIASDGPVESVKVFSKKPVEEICSLALDTSSRTSAALVQILLNRKNGFLPVLSECDPGSSLWDMKEDALLLIGDPAMKFQSNRPIYTVDLGEEWKRQTGLPFVYALWIARRGCDLGDLRTHLMEAREKGLANLGRICSEASAETGLDERVCLNYLKNAIQFHFGPREMQGLALFQKLAAEQGLCPGGVEIAIHDR